MKDVDVLAVNTRAGLAVRSDDILGDFVQLIDADGDDTDDVTKAVVAVVAWRDEGFSSLVLSDYEIKELN